MTFLARGCAQWTAMARQDKIIVSTIGCAAAGAGIGAAAGSGGHASGRGAVIGGLTNALICGTLAYFMTQKSPPAPAPPPPAPPPPPPPAPAGRERPIGLGN